MSAKALEKKKQQLEELKGKIDSATVMVVSDYRGLTVKEITELRKNLRSEESEYAVLKNSLLEKAVAGTEFANLKDYFQGPTALLLGYKDPVSPVKVLVKFVKGAEKGEIKAGIIEKFLVGKEQILEIAKLPPREILIAKLAGGLRSPLYGLVNVLQASVRSLVYALNAICEKKGGEKK